MTIENQVSINQNVAILIDGNNIERSIHSESHDTSSMLNIETLVPELLKNRQLNRMVYFREGRKISTKLEERLQRSYHGSVIACHKSADIPLTIKATQLASKVDTIIIMSGDSDFVELVTHLKAMGVRVEIAAVKSTTSKYLLEVADQFHEVTNKHWFVYSKKRPTYNKTKTEAATTTTTPQPKPTPTKTLQTDEQRLEQSLRDKERNRKIREEREEREEKSPPTQAPINTKEQEPQAKVPQAKETEVKEAQSTESEQKEAPVTKKKVAKKVTKKKVAKKTTKKVAKKVAKKVTKKKVAKKVTKKATKKVSKKV